MAPAAAGADTRSRRWNNGYDVDDRAGRAAAWRAPHACPPTDHGRAPARAALRPGLAGRRGRRGTVRTPGPPARPAAEVLTNRTAARYRYRGGQTSGLPCSYWH